MSQYFKQGDKIKVIADHTSSVTTSLPLNTYIVDVNEFTGEHYLEIADNLEVPETLFGNIEEKGSKIYRTFKRRASSTGALLSGLKGTGKTLLTKYISSIAYEDGYPTILVNKAFKSQNFMQFIQSIDTPCVIIFDEFEKNFEQKDQSRLLTMLDGVMDSKKLYLFTANDQWGITDHMHNRPGRIYYHINYDSLDEEFIDAYCRTKIKNEEHINDIKGVLRIFSEVNFDMLQTVIEEVNEFGRCDKSVIEDLNIDPESDNEGSYTIDSIEYVDFNGKNVKHILDDYFYGNPFTDDWHCRMPKELKESLQAEDIKNNTSLYHEKHGYFSERSSFTYEDFIGREGDKLFFENQEGTKISMKKNKMRKRVSPF